MHSVGSIPHNNEIDVPLNYADYYYIEALKYAGEITYDAKDFKKSLTYFSVLEDVSINQEDLSISKKGQFYCFHYLFILF